MDAPMSSQNSWRESALTALLWKNFPGQLDLKVLHQRRANMVEKISNV
jgi:hypothetical protein